MALHWQVACRNRSGTDLHLFSYVLVVGPRLLELSLRQVLPRRVMSRHWRSTFSRIRSSLPRSRSRCGSMGNQIH